MKHLNQKFCTAVYTSFFLAFTFLGFGTLELYVSNKEELWFAYSDILLILAVLLIIVVGVFTIILILIPDTFFKYGISIIFGIALALYIQGNFLPNNYGALDGTSIDWRQYQGRFLYNSLIWCMLVLGSVLLAKKNVNKFFKLFKVLTGMILATQIITLVTVCLMSPKVEHNNILSTEGEFEISETNNTFVFVLDCFDSELFCELLKQYPEKIENDFEDFTFYHNIVGGATRTKYAIPYIFTGQANVGDDSYSEYLKTSFNSSPLIKELKSGKYDARIYTDSGYVDMEQTGAINNIATDTLRPTSALKLTIDFLKLTAFRYTPHALKRYFWVYSGDFDKWKTSTKEDAYVCDDIAFYDTLVTEQLQYSQENNVFRFYHLNGAHAPYSMNENCEKIDYSLGNEQDQALGSLKIVSEFISQLKTLGAYEHSTIFIMADHGGRNYEQNPLFLVKQSGQYQAFVQSETPLWYKNLPDIFTCALKGKRIDFEKDYIYSEDRLFYVGNEENNKINITEFVARGTAYDYENFFPTGNIFLSNTGDGSYAYKIGEELSFTKDATANAYCISGFSTNEVTHTWTNTKETEMYFELKGRYDNLLLELEYGVYAPPQSVEIYVNEKLVADYIAYEGGQKSIIIPKEYIQEDKLNLELKLPDAVSPQSIGESSDSRLLALAMRKLKLSSTSLQFDMGSQVKGTYKIGSVLSFSDVDKNTKDYCTMGFSHAESQFTWTDGKTAEMEFMILEDSHDGVILEYTCAPYNGKQHIFLYANDQNIAEYEVMAEETKEVFIPPESFEDGRLNLRFELPDAVSPKELGVSEDDRILGLAMKNLVIRAVE